MGLLDRAVTDLRSQRPMLYEVQAAARLEIAGLVVNTHLIQEGMPDTVLEGIHVGRALEAVTGIPLRFCSVLKGLAGTASGRERTADHRPMPAMELEIVAPFAPKPWGTRRSTVM